jgi:hypothetical protein
MSGVLPLNHQEILAWAALRSVVVYPYEVDALMTLDAVLRNPEPKVEPES